ncbi:hypothetical protein WJX74_009918 [Apatococcus lobatus]|uniref:Uncharacterized protein n=1 Tax=Apatococcus lobatus TaxID=904363 RepID=A0AAW1QDR7_9CHLO
MGSNCCKQQEVPVERLQVIRWQESPVVELDEKKPADVEEAALPKEPSQDERAKDSAGLYDELSQDQAADESASLPKDPPKHEAAEGSDETYSHQKAPNNSANSKDDNLQDMSPAHLLMKLPSGVKMEVNRSFFLESEAELLDSPDSNVLSVHKAVPDGSDALWLDISKNSHIQALVTHIDGMADGWAPESLARLGLADLSLTVWPLQVQRRIRALRLTIDEHDIVNCLDEAISKVMQADMSMTEELFHHEKVIWMRIEALGGRYSVCKLTPANYQKDQAVPLNQRIRQELSQRFSGISFVWFNDNLTATQHVWSNFKLQKLESF